MSGMLSQYKATRVPATKIELSFDTYRNYLSCIRKDWESRYSTLEKFAQYAWSEYKKISTSTTALSEKEIRRFLMIAWNTEYLAKTNVSPEIEIIKVSNQWRPIQAYYSIYSGGEAASYALDGILLESHARCISKLNTFFVERVKIRPWCFSYRGSMRKGFISVNLPADTKLINNLSRKTARDIDMIATCIKAEHQNRTDEYKARPLSKEDKREGKKKVPRLDKDMGFTTILNLLVRLRIKSNYKDAEIFICNAPNAYIKKFGEDLSFIVDTTLMLLEMIIIRRWDKDKFIQLANSYVKSNKFGKDNGEHPLMRRLEIYAKLTSK